SERERDLSPHAALARIDGLRARLGARPALDDAVGLLIACGELESAVSDALASGTARDEPGEAESSLGELTLAAAVLHLRAWRGQPAGREVGRIGRAVEVAHSLELPARVRTHDAEGFAFQGVHPETYSEAATAWARALGPG